MTSRARSSPTIEREPRARSTSSSRLRPSTRRDHAALGAVRAQVARERARVDVADADDPGLVQVAVELARTRATTRRGSRPRAPRSPPPAACADSTSSDVDAVVADVGVRHGDDLAGVGGIGQHLLVAAERGVEHDLAGRSRPGDRTTVPRRPARPPARGPHARSQTPSSCQTSVVRRAHRRASLFPRLAGFAVKNELAPARYSTTAGRGPGYWMRPICDSGQKRKYGLAVDVLLRHLAPAAAVVAAVPVVAQHEVVALAHLHGRPRLVVAEAARSGTARRSSRPFTYSEPLRGSRPCRRAGR